jgi:hypothetical protein
MQSPGISSHLRPNIPLSTLFSHTPNIIHSWEV